MAGYLLDDSPSCKLLSAILAVPNFQSEVVRTNSGSVDVTDPSIRFSTDQNLSTESWAEWVTAIRDGDAVKKTMPCYFT